MPKIPDEQIAYGKEPFCSIIKSIEKISRPNGATFEEIFNDLQYEEKKEYVYDDGSLDFDLVFDDVKKGCLESGKESRSQKRVLSDALWILENQGFIAAKGKPKYYHYSSTGKAGHIRFFDRIDSCCRSYKSDTIFTKSVREPMLPRLKTHNEAELCLFGFPSEKIGHEIYEELSNVHKALQSIQKKVPGGHIAFFWRSYSEIEESKKDSLKNYFDEKQEWYSQMKKKEYRNSADGNDSPTHYFF